VEEAQDSMVVMALSATLCFDGERFVGAWTVCDQFGGNDRSWRGPNHKISQVQYG